MYRKKKCMPARSETRNVQAEFDFLEARTQMTEFAKRPT